jgi:type II secretory pathway component PulF
MILLIFIYGVVLFYLPNLLAYYAETGEALSPVLRFVLDICYLVHKAEIVVIPALILGFFFAVIWRIQSSIKYRKHDALINSSN